MTKGCNTTKNSDVGVVVPAKSHAEKGGCNLKGDPRAPMNKVQTQESSSSFMTRQYATKLGTEHLKGWEGADMLKGWEGSDSASLELLDIKESLKRWKKEVDVGLERLEAVIKKLECGGSGSGLPGQLILGPKGKEKMRTEGNGVRRSKKLKPKLIIGSKKKKLSPMIWRKRRTGETSSLQIHGNSERARVALAESKNGTLGFLEPGLSTPGMARLKSKGVSGGQGEADNPSRNVPVEAADTLGSLRETGATPMRKGGAILDGRSSSEEDGAVGRMIPGDMGPSKEAECPQTVTIGRSVGLGPPRETATEQASGVGVTEEAGFSLGQLILANKSASLFQVQGGGSASSMEVHLPVAGENKLVEWSPDESDRDREKVSEGVGELGFPATESELRVGCSTIDFCHGASSLAEAGTEVGNLVNHVPLNSYMPSSGGESDYSDWVVQCAKEIYPIVGISFVGHKLQLLALLSFLEGERRNNAMVANTGSGTKGKREMKNLECSVNYEVRGSNSSRGNRKGRGKAVIS